MTLASIGRFHFLEQAQALAGLSQLERFYCDDPRVLPRVGCRRGRWLARAAWRRRWGQAGPAWCGTQVAQAVAGARVVKVNSAFALETIRRQCAERIWVDHGSLDERFVARRMREEAERWGDGRIAEGGNHGCAELVEREAEEFARAEGVIVASELAKRSLVDQGVPAGKVWVVPLAVDSRVFAPVPKPPGRRPFRILHAGPVTFNKGIHRLIDAFRRAVLPGAELWIVGRAPGRPMLEYFKEQARGAAVRLLPPVRQRDLPALFAECDLFALATLADGFGLTVLQAMACGLPAVVTDQAGCAEVLEGCPAAATVPAGDSGALAAALEERFARPDKSGCDGAAARDWVSRLTWQQSAERLLQAVGRGEVGR